MYSHIPKSGLEKGNPSVKDFYMADELKYHGKKNRGAFLLDFGGMLYFKYSYSTAHCL